jgi:hydrogenase expression/formation protein HypC
MCLSQVGRVTSVDEAGLAVVEVEGLPHRVSLAPLVLDGRSVRPGDWVLIHTGLAVEVLDEADALGLIAVTDSPQEE